MLISGRCHCGNIFFARLAAGAVRNPGSRLHLLVLREAWRCLDLLPDRIAHGERQGSHTRIKNTRSAPRLPSFTCAPAVAWCRWSPAESTAASYAVVSVNAFENVEPALLRRAPATFEGENEQARLSRRKRNWIADVR